MKIRAAISPCPNDVFIFAGLLTGAVPAGGLDFEFDFQDLESLNLGVLEGRWDMAKISYANFSRCSGSYRLLRCGGALGRGCGPLLLSNREEGGVPEWDPDAEVLVPGAHTTANFLLDFHHRHSDAAHPDREGRRPPPLRKAFLPFDALYRRLLGDEPCQGVVIHEMRFTYAADGLHLVRDLGAFWEGATGHPIPLGAVALRREAENREPGLGAAIEALIRKSLDWSQAHPAEAMELCRGHAQSMDAAVLQAHIELYVNSFSRDIGREGEAAVAFFLDRQAHFESEP